ncbi:MAG: hypothetical protein R6W81_03915 [Bacteroidales bacterium]
MKKASCQVYITLILVILILSDLTGFVTAQTGQEDASPQFLYPDYSESVVRLKNGQERTLSLNYNMVTENMVYEQDGKLYDLIGLETIDTIFIRGYSFVPFGKVFHEVVLTGPVTLFIQHQGALIPPGKPAGYGGTSQTSSITSYSGINTAGGFYNLKLPSDYKVNVNPTYWVRMDYQMHSFINKRQFLKIFPEHSGELKQFIKKNRIRFDNREHIVRIINYCNEFFPAIR